MNQLLQNSFWRSYLITSVVMLFLLPAVSYALMQHSSSAVAVTMAVVTQSATSTTIAVSISNPHQIPLNAVETEVQFDPLVLSANNVSITSPLCEERFVITNNIDNVAGNVLIQCGTITPFSGTSTSVATIEFVPLALATSTIIFGSSTNLYAHDGFGTNVTGSTTPLTFF